MKRLSTLCLLVLILATSCQTSSDLGSTALIQKRRYAKGINLNFKKPAVAHKDQFRNATAEKTMAGFKEYNDTKTFKQKSFLLKADKSSDILLASMELSKSLLNKNTQSEKEKINPSIAPPSESQEAYPLTLEKNRNRLIGNGSSVAASGGAEVTILIIILTIILPPLGVALVFGIGIEFWISLLLTLLFYIPGLIYSLIVVLR
jgi:uncharacterized membrane protein YqaE (UPF0057 family)